MHQTTVAKLEGGTRPTSVGEVEALAAIFGIPIGVLFVELPVPQLELVRLHAELAAIAEERTRLRERLKSLDAQELSVATRCEELEQQVTPAGLVIFKDAGKINVVKPAKRSTRSKRARAEVADGEH